VPYVIATSKLHPGDRVTPDHLELVDQPRAVVTLEEARAVVQKMVRVWRDDDDSLTAWSAAYNHLQLAGTLDEPGGTVGPLPNGTVIEVRLVQWRDLDPRPGNPRTIIDAFNARERSA